MADIVKINELIEIEVETDSEYSGRYKTRVEDVNENGIVIGMPMEKGTVVPLRPDTEIIIWQWDNLASYAHFCRIKERAFEPLPLLFLEWPYKKEKVQRRSFVRVPTNLKIEFALDKKHSEKPVFYSSFIRDLSGGGTQFPSDKARFKKGDILIIKLHLPKEKIECKAEVVWAYDDVFDTKSRHLVGIEFYEIPEGIRDRVIRYVFIRQRELIKKGVL